MLPVTLQGLEHSGYQDATKFIERSDAAKMALGGGRTLRRQDVAQSGMMREYVEPAGDDEFRHLDRRVRRIF